MQIEFVFEPTKTIYSWGSAVEALATFVQYGYFTLDTHSNSSRTSTFDESSVPGTVTSPILWESIDHVGN